MNFLEFLVSDDVCASGTLIPRSLLLLGSCGGGGVLGDGLFGILTI